MLKRWSVFGLGFVLLSLPFSYMIVTSNEQGPWLVASAIYFVIGALIGNWYVFFGTQFDAATFWKWLLLIAIAAGAIALAYLNIIGAVRL